MSDDDDRKAILGRRNRLIALALTGLSSAGCYQSHEARDAGEMVDSSPMPCLSPPDDAGPFPCLEPPLGDGGPVPCLSIARDGGEPTPCLGAPLEDAGPEVCLSAAFPGEPSDPDA